MKSHTIVARETAIKSELYTRECLGVKLHLRDGRMARRRESNLVHFSRKMWHLVALILTLFLKKTNWPNFVWLLVDSGFYPPP